MATRPYSDTLREALRDPRDAAAYLEAALVEEDEEGFLLALRTVSEVHGMAALARKAGVGRESLYKTLSEDGNPKLRTLMALLHNLGLRLSVAPEENKRKAAR
jgi:probable addiction module antidote protein